MPEHTPVSILLVEDQAIIAMTERRMLEQHGYRVEHAAHAQQAMDLIGKLPELSLVLMDIDLGDDMDGTELAKRILAERDIPIVFLTSHGEEEMVRKVKEVTRYGYVMKNAGQFVLLESIEMALRLYAAQKELRQRNHFIETILDNLPIGLAVNYIDEGTATYMNRKFQEIYGWQAADLKDIAGFFARVYPDPEYRARLASRITSDIQSGDSTRMHWENIKVQRGDGSTALVDAVNIPIYEQNFMISTVTDVTERVQTNELYRKMIDDMTDGFAIVAENGIIRDANDAYCSMMGYDREDLVGRHIGQLDAVMEQPQLDQHLSTLFKHGGGHFLTRNKRKDGSKIAIDIRSSVVDAAEPLIVAIVHELDPDEAPDSTFEDANRWLQNEARTKDTMLKELKHRVKNNLAMISSLLNMKRDALGEDVDLSDLVHRVSTIQLMYDQLHQRGSVRTIQLGSYLDDLLGSLFSSLSPYPVSVLVTGANDPVPADIAV